jgi:hypothetical protein
MSTRSDVKWQHAAVVAGVVAAATSIAVINHTRRTRRNRQDNADYHPLQLPVPSQLTTTTNTSVATSTITVAPATAVTFETKKSVPPSLEYCRALPKIELHAHLSGSVRASTALELLAHERARLVARERALTAIAEPTDENKNEIQQLLKDIASIDKEKASFATETKRNPEQCWTLFAILHRVLDNNDAIARVTRGMYSIIYSHYYTLAHFCYIRYV